MTGGLKLKAQCYSKSVFGSKLSGLKIKGCKIERIPKCTNKLLG